VTTVQQLRGALIVSCQAYTGEPMRDPRTTAQVAQSVVIGGARAVRVQGIADIEATVAAVDVPVIGLWKDGPTGVVITPTLRHALAVARAGAHVVALDGTRRRRPDGLSLAQTVTRLRVELDRAVLVMADCGSLADALAAEDAGVDLVGTTLAGYTDERPRGEGPDLELAAEIVGRCALPVVVEGRVTTPQHASAALASGAWAVCVGTAITHPATITSWFCAALDVSSIEPGHHRYLTSDEVP